MAKPKKDGHFINIYLDRTLYNRLSFYAEEKGQTKTLAVERILKQYFDEHNVPSDVTSKSDE